ncbi:TonB-dependent receptor plug domain-containing protein [Sinomicrobium sp. FJxs]|uniref:TonB-dependent receptor plug domain-containing protein n=2 Tax=Sinomicrobium weinanense TaxID=2842200 RepID=A0A926JUV0_9FLAO|nr:TonB-dependent receptor plug domain-containing protein [Sinomicrobium weinanense]MBU3125500.1 TonB-dependent receptor plug domain-containing protein [Sinomicrobium weinanense]
MLLTPIDFTYEFTANNTILLKKKAGTDDKPRVEVVREMQQEVSGTVMDEQGLPLVGANIVEKGTTNGTQTDFDGNFTLSAGPNVTLVISYIGFRTQEVAVGGQSRIDVTLVENTSQLNEVIVTALGIQKTRSSLTYAAQDINAEELSRVKQSNPINSLSGKVAGVAITRSASGVGGSVKVTLRGNNSFGNNQPLYVVDGIPLSNPTASQPDSNFGSSRGDGGDVLSLINPDDIESLTVLKGASASALYGNAGLNGVILITTKKGKEGTFKVDFSSNLTVERAAYMLDLNDTAEDNADDFFESGLTNINSLSISGGTEKAQTYFSYSNSFASGILPENDLKQHTINLRETAKFFDDVLAVNAGVMASTQKITNRAVPGLYFNPLVGAYGFPADAGKLSDYADFEEYNPDRNIQSQRWFRGTSDIEQNPYWIMHRNPSTDTNKKLLASLNLSFKVTDWLSLQTRGTYDQSLMDFERKVYATTEATLSHANGRYILNKQDVKQLYGDIIANIDYNFTEAFSLNANIGASIRKSTTEVFNADSGTQGGLQFANVFAIQNFNANPQVTLTQSSLSRRVNSVFASATLGYDEKIFVDLTARNDWSSTLPPENNSFFYPSFGVTGILSEMFDLGNGISFAKVRASYAEVGNDFAPNQINPAREIVFGNGVSATDPVRPFPGTIPEPEKQRSFEVGTEWRFFNNRLGIDIGYYNTNTVNQYFPFPTSVAIIGAANAGLNSGEIVNSGVEATVFATPVQTDSFRWKTTLNFSANDNEVKSIYDGTIADGLIEPDFFTVSAKGVNTFGSYLVEGGSFGDIYAQVVKRDAQGRPVVDGDALIINDENPENVVDGLEKVGNANPDFTLGWNNSFSYGNFSLDFLIDGKFGGETVSMTEAVVEGLSNNTSRETTNGSVEVVDLAGNVSTMTAQQYYGLAGGRNGFTGEYVYSATNVRLAEVALGYSFDLEEDSFFSNISASLIGSNLFFFYKDAPHDPNISLSTGNALQGVDILGLPSTRSIGLNVKLTF